MKNILRTAALVIVMSPLAAHMTVASAAAPKSYQVTGPVTALSDATVTVQKGSEKWEIAKGAAAVPAGLKVGDKVTIQYTMTATTIAAKPAK